MDDFPFMCFSGGERTVCPRALRVEAGAAQAHTSRNGDADPREFLLLLCHVRCCIFLVSHHATQTGTSKTF